MHKHLKPLNKEAVEKIYSQTNNLHKTAKIIGCGYNKIQNFCKENNIKHQFVYNHQAFSQITLENCYWAGFIAADGCIYKAFTKVVIHKKDLNHLVKYHSFLNSTKTPLVKKKYAFSNIRSKQIKSDLLCNFNITPKKSLTLLPPNLNTEEQKRNFIRGFSDGDGCLSIEKERGGIFTITGGSKAMIEWIRDAINYYLKIYANIYIKNEKYFTISYSGQTCVPVLNWLYKDSINNLRLNRKYKKFKTIIKTQQEKKEKQQQKKEKLNSEIKQMKDLYLTGLTYRQIAKIMNIKHSKVFYYMSKDKSIVKARGFQKRNIIRQLVP